MPQCSPLLLASSESTTTISATQPTPLANKDKDKDNSNSRLSWSRTLPIGLADMEEEEEENKEKENKVPEAPRKQEPSWETAHTLLITPMNLSRHFQPDPMMMMMYSWTLHKLHEMRQKVMMRKRLLWQLLLQRSSRQQTPIVLVVAGLFFLAPCTTSTPRTFPRYNPSHQGVASKDSKEKGDRGRVQDIRPGRHQWWIVVWSPNLYLLVWSSWQGSDDAAGYDKQLHWTLQDTWKHIPDHAHTQTKVTSSKEKINKI